jgi:hypothetical protein
MDANSSAIAQGTAIGTAAQLAMVVSGHYSPPIANLFAVGGMAISLGAGLLYARKGTAITRGSAALGGALVGGLCGLLGIIVSYSLGDVTAVILLFGTLSSAVTGAIGGAIGYVSSGRSVRA